MILFFTSNEYQIKIDGEAPVHFQTRYKNKF